MTYLVLRLLSLLCLVLIVRSEVKQCTQANVDKCTAPFQNMNITLESAIVPIHDEATVRLLCKNFDQMESCLKPMMPSCGTVDRLYLQGLSDGYEYMCDETLEEYIKYLPCLKQPDIHKEGEICNTTWTDRLDSLNRNQVSGTDRVKKLCHYTNEYLDCVENTVKTYCGEGAATWQRTLDERHLKPLLCALGCDFVEADNVGCGGVPEDDSFMSSRNLIVLSAVMVISLILLIPLIVFMYLYYKKQKKRRSHQRERQSAVYVNSGDNGVQAYLAGPGMENPSYTGEKNGMPPPYAVPYAVPYATPYTSDGAIAQPPPYATNSEYNHGSAKKTLPPPPSEAGAPPPSEAGAASVAGSRRSNADARSSVSRY